MSKPRVRVWPLKVLLIVGFFLGGCGRQPSPEVDEIMNKLAKGPTSLTPALGKALQQDPPPWETIQRQSREYVALATDLGKYRPQRAPRDSWVSLTGAYAEAAVDLEKAAQAKDKEAALAAHSELASWCEICKRAHRGERPPDFLEDRPPPGEIPPKSREPL